MKDKFKNDLAAKLQILPQDPGGHLYNRISDEYAREMTAECYDDEKLCWMCLDNKDNHFWDCEVMALVAAYELDIRNWKSPGYMGLSERRPGFLWILEGLG